MKQITTQKQVDDAAPKSAPYSLGSNLYLNVEPSGSRQWQFIWKASGKKQYAGLGSAGGAKGHRVTLVEARAKANQWRAAIARDEDPRLDKRKGETIGMFAEKLIAKLKPQWRGARTEHGWRRSLFHFAKPIIDLPISTPSDELAPKIKAIIDPLRGTQYDVARHARQRLEEVFREAKAAGLRSGENPGTRDAIGWSKERGKRKINHRRAIPYEQAPTFFARLDMTARGHAGLRLLVMTATRTSEVLRAAAGQFTLDGPDPQWVIPFAKNGEPHTIPLTGDLLVFLRSLLKGLGPDDLLFPAYSCDTLLDSFRRIDPAHAAIDVHGFRSTFRDWCGNETPFAREIIEETFGHNVGNSVERAYRRRKALRKRRMVLDAWNAYLAGRLPLERDGFEGVYTLAA